MSNQSAPSQLREHKYALKRLKRKGPEFRVSLDLEVERAVRYKRPLSLLCLQIQRAEHCHKTAWDDQRRRLMAEFTRESMERYRTPDFFAPLPAGVFAICLPETEEYGAKIAGQKLMSAITEGDGARWMGSAIRDVIWTSIERGGERNSAALLNRALANLKSIAKENSQSEAKKPTEAASIEEPDVMLESFS